jgi:hypothetical protein
MTSGNAAQTNKWWMEAEVAVCQEVAGLQPQGREGEVLGQNEMRQPASANKEGKPRMDDNQGNIQ